MNLIYHSASLHDVQPDTWNNYLLQLSEPHILQTWQWGLLKSEFGWRAFPTFWRDSTGEVVAAALVLVRRIAFKGFISPLGVMYVPKGPLLRDWQDEHLRWCVLDDLAEIGHKHRCIFIKIDPDVRLGIGIPGQSDSTEDALGHLLVDELKKRKWLFSREQIQFRNTMLMDLSGSSDELLAKMKQKTRYNLRIAIKRGVTVRLGTSSDLTMLYRMYAETSVRDGFVIREEGYYRRVWEIFLKVGMADILIAEVQSEPVAAIVLFRFDGKGWFFYGMSRNVYREKMANYLLQWEAMLRLKVFGCRTYDMWGAPDKFDESDVLWGVYRFKEGFGGKVIRHIGAWDLPLRPFSYHLYANIMPRVLNRMRLRGIRHTINELRVL